MTRVSTALAALLHPEGVERSDLVGGAGCHSAEYVVAIESEPSRDLVDGRAAAEPGHRLFIAWNEDDVHLFDEDGTRLGGG